MRICVIRLGALAAFLFAASSSAAFAQLRSRVVVTGLSMPVAFVQDPTDGSVQYIVQQGGRIRVLKNGTLQATDLLNLTSSISCCGERGLLGLAFAPDYAASGRAYVDFTNPSGNIVVARFLRSASNRLTLDPATRFDMHWNGASGAAVIVHQPNANHNGGNLMFGPRDGYLYIGTGDGGSGDDPPNNAQTPSQLLGKMLRIDVNVASSDPIGYAIPPDNPFVSSSLPGVRPEIWAFGLRNPWRYSFDDPARGGTGALVIGDVGQSLWEEVDYEPALHGGRNYGWRNREGAHDHITSLPPAYTPLTDPIFEYSHASGGIAITGGFVYRGRALGTNYVGRYFFADYGTGQVWSFALVIDPATGEAQPTGLIEHTSQLGPTGNISSFGVDAAGELYIVDYNGRILAIESTKPVAPAPPGDIDGDGRTDLIVWRPGTGTWYMLDSSSGYASSQAVQWGNQSQGDVPILADMDGDGIRDLVLWRASTGTWFWLTSSSGYAYSASHAVQWGNQSLGDVPLVGDIDGDGKGDLIVWRAPTGTWFWLTSSTSYATASSGGRQWGNASLGDVPIVGDFDGDGRTDLTVWRASTGTWFWLTSSNGYSSGQSVQWGNQSLGDVPLVADMDGDGKSDPIVWRTSTGTWFWLTSSSGFSPGAMGSVQWGNESAGDRPVLGDFDGDGRADVAVWRASTGTWFWLTSSSGYAPASGRSAQWGNQALGDIPITK